MEGWEAWGARPARGSLVKLFGPEPLIVCQSDTLENPEMMFGGKIVRQEQYDSAG